MGEATGVLRFTEQRPLPLDTYVYQVDDGTLFFHKYSSPQRLYVEWMGESVWAKLEGGEIDTIANHENAVYYCMNRMIYKAVFVPPNRIKTTFIRNIFVVDQILCGGLVLQKRERTPLAFRLWDTKGVLIEEQPADGFMLVGIHKNKALYAKHGCGGEPNVVEMNGNILKITLPHNDHPTLLTRDSWSLIYIENARMLFTFDTTTMKFLQSKRMEGNGNPCTLKSIRIGVMYSMCWGSDKWYLEKAKLPKELIDPASVAEDQERQLKLQQQRERQKRKQQRSSQAEPPSYAKGYTAKSSGSYSAVPPNTPTKNRPPWRNTFSYAPQTRPPVVDEQHAADSLAMQQLLQLAGQTSEANGTTSGKVTKERELEEKNENLVDENEQMKRRISELEKMLKQSEIGTSGRPGP